MLKVLEGNSRQPKYIQYTFTDVSTAFLGTAQVKFRDYKNMDFRILNIENDPLGQGFDHDSYDLILASNVCKGCQMILPGHADHSTGRSRYQQYCYIAAELQEVA